MYSSGNMISEATIPRSVTFIPGFPILEVFRLNGQPKRDGSILQGQSISGLSDKGCDSCREPCFLSVFVVFRSPANGMKAH